MPTIILEPHDTLFFRDGRPYDKGESCTGLSSLFPPSPLTLVGAVRAAWARNMGWSGRGPWKEQMSKQQLSRLGGDNQELSGLACKGPLLLLNDTPIFPAPACLLGKTSGSGQRPQKIIRIKPSTHSFQCDLGTTVYLPINASPDEEKTRKTLSGWWLTWDDFSKILAGKTPKGKDLINAGTLWNNEPRVGIAINHQTGTVEESALYAINHIRLQENLALALDLEGDLTEFPTEALIPLGGEARSCWLQKLKLNKKIVPPCNLDYATEQGRYAVHVLTPLQLDHLPGPGDPLAGLPGRMVSCCMLRSPRLGGWDTINQRPLPRRPYVTPGSVFFIKTDSGDQFDKAISSHGGTIGLRSSWGFGLIAIGSW